MEYEYVITWRQYYTKAHWLVAECEKDIGRRYVHKHVVNGKSVNEIYRNKSELQYYIARYWPSVFKVPDKLSNATVKEW